MKNNNILIMMIIFLILFLSSLFPVVEDDLTDSGRVDNILELLIMAGQRSLPEVCTSCTLSPPSCINGYHISEVGLMILYLMIFFMAL